MRLNVYEESHVIEYAEATRRTKVKRFYFSPQGRWREDCLSRTQQNVLSGVRGKIPSKSASSIEKTELMLRDANFLRRFHIMSVGALFLIVAAPVAAIAAPCGNGAAGFNGWLQQFRSQAAAQGISQSTIESALSNVSYDRKVVRLDNSQHSFKLSFKKFYALRVNNTLIGRGRSLMRKYGRTLDRIERRFGVPGAVLVAIWGLETHYGANLGARYSIIRSLATLAYDCRRPEFFQGQLLDALRIIDRGDLSARQLRGGWAGEIGQTQFLPTAYYRYAVDFDGNGHRDLVHSVPDALASTANFLASHGWQRGQSWEPGSHNYGVIGQWNKADVYQRTIAVMADKLSGRG